MIDSSSARQNILNAIGSQHKRSAHGISARRIERDMSLTQTRVGPQPTLTSTNLQEVFIEQARALQSEVRLVERKADICSSIEAYLTQQQLPKQLVIWQDVADLDWQDKSLEVFVRDCQEQDAISVTSCFAAIAETGSLVLLSSATTPLSHHLFPHTHIAIVYAEQICARIEDAFALIKKNHHQPPRTISIVSGPSRTGDIEQTIVLGAHGPKRVCIVLVTSRA